MSLRLEQIKLFLAVVELGSFAAAGDKLNLPQPTVSRHIKQLEDTLGIHLFDRGKRKVTLNEFGHGFLHYANRIYAANNDALMFAEGCSSTPSGNLVIEAVPGICEILLRHFDEKFAQQYPEIKLSFRSLRSSDGDKPLQGDIRIHMQKPKEENLIARTFIDIERDFYATPDFIARYGPFSHPSQLQCVPCIQICADTESPEQWMYLEHNRIQTLDIQPILTVDIGYLAISAAINNRGVIWAPPILIAENLERGELVPLFKQQFTYTHPVYLIYRSNHYQPPKERVFIASLLAQFDRDTPYNQSK
ncbi:LysR family transcriptional regulator [Corallincola luteus]|uniref:LysR family transcriptional regulator n=1 Tax=Corallincola luteus TaxID=1775177 RepID=A0ABY2AIZ8_9GAMM|nr:LysR family transcriptional regulator [Corallincola luteus]TCI02697.1 LysR family transcriptional regulator [Corallincola luteus]